MRRNHESAFDVVVAARPYGPPLTAAEQMLRVALVAAFFGLLALEGWLLWHVWALWAR